MGHTALDIDATRKLLSELREGYQCLPRHLQLRVLYVLRESSFPANTDSKSNRPGTSRLKLVPRQTSV
jgi:hypothetical protein